MKDDLDLDAVVVVALGSNLPGAWPTSEALLEAALERLTAAGLKVVRRSRWWRSAAWPDPTAPDYRNGVALVETSLTAADTMAVLHDIEADFGRRRGSANADRTLDLDLVAFGRMLQATDPVLPHPRAHERAFVMGPLAEIAPAWRHPRLGRTAAELQGSASVGQDAAPL